MTYDEFLEKLTNAKSIKCKQWNVMDGDLLYHILDIYDKEYVATKYYGKHKQWWHYRFYDARMLFVYYQNEWIEVRNGN
jgi:hypothetical protein